MGTNGGNRASDGETEGLRRNRLSILTNRYVLVAFVVQTVSYAVLVGFFEPVNRRRLSR